MEVNTISDEPTTTAIAPWFGSNRMLAPIVGEEVGSRAWCGVPFAGGMSELRCIKSRTIHVNDKHRLVINMARVMADAMYGPKLYRELRRQGFHPDTLDVARKYCQTFGPSPADEELSIVDYCLARNYFICCWMGRSAKAGTRDEFKGKLPVRYTISGGDSAVRYQSATSSIVAWRRILRRCTFATDDVFDFVEEVKDEDWVAVYADQPFPDAGQPYKHGFTERETRDLAERWTYFKNARIVCRFYDHPLVRELYPEDRWTWRFLDGGRTQANKKPPEVLLINGPSYA